MIDRLWSEFLTRSITNLFAYAEVFSGHCFRCVKPKYSNSLDAFSGEGSRQASGRFHVKGSFILVYTSTDLKTAEWEYFNTARSRGFDPAFLLPFTAISANVHLFKVLYLSTENVLTALGVTLDEIRDLKWADSSEETLTQIMGRLAFEAGFEAILAPTVGGHNLNILRQNLRPDSRIEIINKDELPLL